MTWVRAGDRDRESPAQTGRLTAPDNEQRGFLSLESDFRIKEIKRRALPKTGRKLDDILSEFKRQRRMRHMALFTRCRNTKGVTNGGA